LDSPSAASGGSKNTDWRLGNNQKEAALATESFYNNAELLCEGKAAQPYITATKLRYIAQGGGKDHSYCKSEDSETDNGAFDKLLEKAGLAPGDFGSMVHAVLEGRLKRLPCEMPQEVRSFQDEKARQSLITIAESMADSFLASTLGKRWASVHGDRQSFSQSEFSVITAAVVERKAVGISGQIDLLFEEDEEVVVLDFKTDRLENPEDHYGQLAAYYRAAGDIFGKPVSLWLYYLRSDHAVNVTEEVKALSLEELAAQAMAE
jgi:ATP-dependent helicase/nuclease subunit A